MNKKGIELSTTFLVTLILTIIVFISSIYFVFRIYIGGRELQQQLDVQTEEELKRLIIDENAIVAIYPSSKKSKIGDQKTFGLGIRNILRNVDSKEFQIVVDFAGAFSPDGKTNYCFSNFEECREYINKNWIGGFRTSSLKIAPQILQTHPLLIKIENKITQNDQTKKGIYYFNVCVFQNTQTNINECTIKERNIVYTQDQGKIQQITLTII